MLVDWSNSKLELKRELVNWELDLKKLLRLQTGEIRSGKDKVEVKRHGWNVWKSNIQLIRILKRRHRKNERGQYSKKW